MAGQNLDSLDLKILKCLQENARIANVQLAAKVGLSPSPCLRRVRDLEKRGVIKKHVTLLDPESVGLPLNVFVQVRLQQQREKWLEVFERAVRDRPEVMECYLMTGDADYLLRVVIPDVKAYERFLMESLTKVQGVANIKSSFALNQIKYGTALPLGEADAVPEEGRARRGATGSKRLTTARKR